MSHFRLTKLALASAIGAALLTGPAMAQTAADKPGDNKPPAAQAATSSKPETVEQRIATLKTSLKITPDQESKWKPVADAMLQNAANMDKLIKTKRAVPAAGMSAVDDLKNYQDFTQAHLDGLKNLIPTFKALYDSMPADQKKNADQVFQKYGSANAGTQG
jgi:protein CpxP